MQLTSTLPYAIIAWFSGAEETPPVKAEPVNKIEAENRRS
jgi:hypothetical protein